MKKTYFQHGWLHDEEYKYWLQRGSDNKHFRCMLCKKDLASTSSAAASSSATSSSAPSLLPASTSTAKSSAAKQIQIPYMFDQESRVKAKIIWSLHCVQHNYSDNSNDGIAKTFQTMFPGTVRLQLQSTK